MCIHCMICFFAGNMRLKTLNIYYLASGVCDRETLALENPHLSWTLDVPMPIIEPYQTCFWCSIA